MSFARRHVRSSVDNMVKHMIIWKLRDSLEDKVRRAEEIKVALERLVGEVDGLLEMHILTDGLDSSSGDVMMDSLFESRDALKAYSSHPKHLAVANGVVRPSVEVRLSFDYEI